MDDIQIICPIHKKKSEYFCIKLLCKKETTRFICDRCLKEGPHKNHENQQINEIKDLYETQIKSYITEQHNNFQYDLEMLNKYQENIIPQKFNQIQKEITDIFIKVHQKLIDQLQSQKDFIQKQNNELNDLINIDFTNLSQKSMNDLAKFLRNTKPLKSFKLLFEQYYDEFLQNTQQIANNWSTGLEEYFENFNKSLSLQLKQKQMHEEEDLQPFNFESFKAEKQFSLKGHAETVYSLILMNNLYGENTDLLVSCSSDHTIKVWDLQKKKCIKTLQPPEQEDFYAIYCLLKFSETKFIYGSTDKTIKIYDYFEYVGVLKGHENDILSLAKVDMIQILSGSHDCTIRLWNVETFECLKVFSEHKDSIDTYCLHIVDKNTFVSVSNDLTIKLWNISIEKSLKTIKMDEQGIETVSSSILYDQKRIIVGNQNFFTIWDLETGKLVFKQNNVYEGYILCITQFDQDVYAMGTDYENIIFWQIKEDDQFKTQPLKSLVQVHNEAAIRTIIRYGNQRFISGGADDKIMVYQ